MDEVASVHHSYILAQRVTELRIKVRAMNEWFELFNVRIASLIEPWMPWLHDTAPVVGAWLAQMPAVVKIVSLVLQRPGRSRGCVVKAGQKQCRP